MGFVRKTRRAPVLSHKIIQFACYIRNAEGYKLHRFSLVLYASEREDGRVGWWAYWLWPVFRRRFLLHANRGEGQVVTCADELDFIARVRFASHETKRILISNESDFNIDFIQHVSILK